MRKFFRLALIFVALISFFILTTNALATPNYIPPQDLTISIYRLLDNGSLYTDLFGNPYLCQTGDSWRGCTADTNYPFQGPNPKTISINNEYLINVVPSEISIEAFHQRSIEAQAIAARSYIYWHLWKNHSINNSTNFQAYIPNTFQTLLINDQQSVLAAVANHSFLAIGPDPLFSEFFADIKNRTITGSEPGELNVDDLISSNSAIIQDGHGRGMSQKGSSRWAYGNMGFQNTLDPWSVTYNKVEQILFHYYTGANMLNENGSLISSSYRWNPQKFVNFPSFMLRNYSYQVGIYIQNVSTSDWNCTYPVYQINLRYWWKKNGNSPQVGINSVSLCGLNKGDPTNLFLINIDDIPQWGWGLYTISFDVKVTNYDGTGFYFSQQSTPWETYDRTTFVPQSASFLPLINSFDVTQ